MPTHLFLLLSIAFVTASCLGGDKHLPSSNPPEYDPKKVHTAPVAQPSAPAMVAKPTELDLLRSKLDSLETGSKEKGEGKKVPIDPNLLQLFKGVTSPCEALSRLAPGLGSTQLFAGQEGVALKKALGPDADGIARRMDERLAEGLKRSLGPGASDCPISVRQRKSSRLKNPFQPARVVLAHASSSVPFLLAQTTIPETSQDDYDVQKSLHREDPPPEWVGWKTTDTMTRIGKEDRPTNGIREDYEMIIAPKAKQCPHLEGPELKGMVDGTFDWSYTMFRATPGPQSVLYRRKIQATLKGDVDDSAQLKKVVKYDAAITFQHIGSELPHYANSGTIHGEFTIDQRTGIPEEFRIITVSGFSEGEAQTRDAQLLGALTALMAFFSGQEYVDAEKIWKHPNTCVEITFTPATKTKKFVPNESTPVKTELRTKKEQTVVPAKFKEARERPREGNGRVSPREKESQLNTPATFTYQTPATKVRHSGFRVKAVSRAGMAEEKDGEWELAPSSYVLEFKSHIVQSPLNLPVTDFGVSMGSVGGFDAHVQATVPLRRRDDGEWVGEGEMQYETRPTTQAAHCEIRIQGSGKTTFHVKGGSIGTDPEPFAVNLIILPGETGELTDIHCKSGNTPEKMKELFATQGVQDGREAHSVTKGMRWSLLFGTTRRRTFNMTRGGYEIGGWTPVQGSDVIAKKTITVSCAVVPLLPCQEVTELTLKQAETSE